MQKLVVSMILFFLLLGPVSTVTHEVVPVIPANPYAAQIDKLVDYISHKFHRPDVEIRKIVVAVYREASPEQFPTPLDALAIMWVESSFNPKAVHKTGPSVGVMQINSGVPGRPSSTELLDPEINVHVGLEILRGYRRETEDVSTTLVRYNAGPRGWFRICGGRSPCHSQYSTKVAQAKRSLSIAVGGG